MDDAQYRNYSLPDGIGFSINGKEWKYRSLAELNEEWEDAPEEAKRHWYIDTSCNLEIFENICLPEEAVEALKSIGNYFSSKEEAEKAVERLRAWKRLKDKGFRFVEWQQHGITEDRVMDGAVYFEDAKNVNRSDLDLLFSQEDD